MNRNRLNGSMHTSHPTMATLVNRAAPWWVNHWEGLFCKDELWLFNGRYHRNIQYCVKSELFGTFIGKFFFPSIWKTLPRHCLKFSSQLLRLVQSIIPFMKGSLRFAWGWHLCMFDRNHRDFKNTSDSLLRHTRREKNANWVQSSWPGHPSSQPDPFN